MKQTIIAIALAFSFGSASAGTYNEAVAAYRQGNAAVAVQSFFELAINKDPDAQYALAVLFEKGDQIERSMPQALLWYQEAAARGNPFAQASLASHLASGEHVDQDHERALDLFLSAAQQGHPQSQYNAAVMLEQGLGHEPDRDQALDWYEKAAAQGHIKAQHNLGLNLATDPRNDDDLVRAYKWLSVAILQGKDELASSAKNARDELARRMTAPTLAKAIQATTQTQGMAIMVAAPVVSASRAQNQERDVEPLVQLGQFFHTDDAGITAEHE